MPGLILTTTELTIVYCSTSTDHKTAKVMLLSLQSTVSIKMNNRFIIQAAFSVIEL